MSEDMKVAKDSIDESTVEGVRSLEADKYKYGFDSDIEQEFAPKGLNEDIVRFISAKKDEPQWLLEWRLEAYARWLTLEEPCLLYTSPSPRDGLLSRMPSSA